MEAGCRSETTRRGAATARGHVTARLLRKRTSAAAAPLSTPDSSVTSLTKTTSSTRADFEILFCSHEIY